MEKYDELWKILFLKLCPSESNFDDHFIADILLSCLIYYNSNVTKIIFSLKGYFEKQKDG